MKQEFVEKESSLLQEIERLELANEQLIQGAPDSDLQQLQVEVPEFGKFLYSASLVIKNGWLYGRLIRVIKNTTKSVLPSFYG